MHRKHNKVRQSQSRVGKKINLYTNLESSKNIPIFQNKEQ